MRYRAVVEYDGTDYLGFQRQREDQPTIQATLEKVVSALARKQISITGAGRTDSGVHALGQVISFDLDWTHGAVALLRAMNANLPADVAVLELKETTPGFHPRFDAQRRVYDYYIYNAHHRSPLRRRYSLHVRRPLNLERMNEAAAGLVGKRDFATFGQPPQGENTVRQVFEASWRRKDEFIVFRVEANAFLYRMVRSLVGTMIMVGDESWSVEEFTHALRACDRSKAGAVAPAHGLFLVSVEYSN